MTLRSGSFLLLRSPSPTDGLAKGKYRLCYSCGSQGKNTWVSFPSPVDHILSEPSTMTHLSWVALHGMAQSFIELDKAVVHWSDWLVFCNYGVQSVCPLMEKDKRLMEASWWDILTEGETGSCSDGWGHESFIQFSVDRWNCVPSLLFTWGHTMVEVSR